MYRILSNRIVVFHLMSTGREADRRPEIVIEFLDPFVAGNLLDLDNWCLGDDVLKDSQSEKHVK